MREEVDPPRTGGFSQSVCDTFALYDALTYSEGDEWKPHLSTSTFFVLARIILSSVLAPASRPLDVMRASEAAQRGAQGAGTWMAARCDARACIAEGIRGSHSRESSALSSALCLAQQRVFSRGRSVEGVWKECGPRTQPIMPLIAADCRRVSRMGLGRSPEATAVPLPLFTTNWTFWAAGGAGRGSRAREAARARRRRAFQAPRPPRARASPSPRRPP